MKQPNKITVRETIHHGDYRNVREQTIAPTWAGLLELLSASPYGGGSGDMVNLYRSHNRYVAKLFADLLTTDAGQHGWAIYKVVEKRGNHVKTIAERLEYLRGQIHAESISYSEIADLQGLAEYIDPGDVELLQWAGVPE